jgi:hypothetical protein
LFQLSKLFLLSRFTYLRLFQNSIKQIFRLIFLPGCTTPLEPPIPVSSVPGKFLDVNVSRAESWMRENILPPYWVKETDGKNKFPLRVTSQNESAHLLRRFEDFQQHSGIPIDENVKVK